MTKIQDKNFQAIKNAAMSLKAGNLVVFPTETVYGLGADATNEEAVNRLYEIKGRPRGHPVIIHISSVNHLHKWAKNIPEFALKLATSFWPGPMTLILQRSLLAKDFITGGQENVAIRIPKHRIALALIREFETLGGLGVAAPSANRFGSVSPTTADAVRLELGNFLSKQDKILNAESCEIGIESTIIDCVGKKPFVIRPGAITNEMILELLQGDFELDVNPHNRLTRAPGNMKSHYAPNAEVILSGTPNFGDGFIALSTFPTPEGAVRLAAPKSNNDFARILYESLRLADKKGIKKVFVIPASGHGIALAINDRLNKASFQPKRTN